MHNIYLVLRILHHKRDTMGKGKDKNKRTRRNETEKEKASKEKQKAGKKEKQVVQDAAKSTEAKRGFIGMWQSATERRDPEVRRNHAAPEIPEVDQYSGLLKEMYNNCAKYDVMA